MGVLVGTGMGGLTVFQDGGCWWCYCHPATATLLLPLLLLSVLLPPCYCHLATATATLIPV